MMEWKKFGVICVLGLTLMAAAGCSDGSKNATSAGTPATQQAQTTKPQGVEKTLYRKPKDGSQKLVAVKTTVQGDTAQLQLETLKELVEKQPEGDKTFPKNLKVNKLTVKDGLATVDLSKEFLTRRAGEYDTTMMIYALVNTLTEFPDIKKVTFTVNGEPVEVLGQMDMTTPFERNETFLPKA